MGSYCVNVFLDAEQEKKIQEAGLGDQIIQVEGKKAVTALATLPVISPCACTACRSPRSP